MIQCAYLNGMTAIPTPAMVLHAGPHILWRTGMNGRDHRQALAGVATQKITYGHTNRLAKQIPAGDINGSLGVIMANKGVVHRVIQAIKVAGVTAKKRWRHFGDTRPHTTGVSRDISRSEWRAFTPAICAIIRDNTNEAGVKTAIFAPA